MFEKFKTEFLPPLPGGLLKWVNLIIFFLKADSIIIIIMYGLLSKSCDKYTIRGSVGRG